MTPPDPVREAARRLLDEVQRWRQDRNDRDNVIAVHYWTNAAMWDSVDSWFTTWCRCDPDPLRPRQAHRPQPD